MRGMWIGAAIMVGVCLILGAINMGGLWSGTAAPRAASAPISVPGAAQAAASQVFDSAQEAEAGPIAPGSWIAFRDFLFDFDQADIPFSDRKKVTEIAAYMAAHPATRLGIDGSHDPNGNGLRNQSLSDRRIAAVRDALVRAGVPAERIHLGEYADPGLRRDRQVAVVLDGAP